MRARPRAARAQYSGAALSKPPPLHAPPRSGARRGRQAASSEAGAAAESRASRAMQEALVQRKPATAEFVCGPVSMTSPPNQRPRVNHGGAQREAAARGPPREPAHPNAHGRGPRKRARQPRRPRQAVSAACAVRGGRRRLRQLPTCDGRARVCGRDARRPLLAASRSPTRVRVAGRARTYATPRRSRRAKSMSASQTGATKTASRRCRAPRCRGTTARCWPLPGLPCACYLQPAQARGAERAN